MITYYVPNLVPTTTEVIGPKTNQKTVGVLPVDQFQSSPDQGREDTDYRVNSRSTWLPLLYGGNVADDVSSPPVPVMDVYQQVYVSEEYGGVLEVTVPVVPLLDHLLYASGGELDVVGAAPARKL